MENIFGIPMGSLAVVLAVILGILLTPVIFTVLFKRVMFRIGIRNIPRRRAQTLLIVRRADALDAEHQQRLRLR